MVEGYNNTTIIRRLERQKMFRKLGVRMQKIIRRQNWAWFLKILLNLQCLSDARPGVANESTGKPQEVARDGLS